MVLVLVESNIKNYVIDIFSAGILFPIQSSTSYSANLSGITGSNNGTSSSATYTQSTFDGWNKGDLKLVWRSICECGEEMILERENGIRVRKLESWIRIIKGVEKVSLRLYQNESK